jgi:outer membrane autotransporter protein
MHGDGPTGGAYLAWQSDNGIRFDAGAAYSSVNITGTAGTASGNFTANRILATAGLTGKYGFSQWTLEPSARVYSTWETDKAYTDSLGTLHPARSFAAGRASSGGKLGYLWQLSGGTSVVPYAGIYGDYYFGKDNDEAKTGSLPTVSGFSARVVSGVSLATKGGAQFAVGGELGGIAGDFTARILRAGASVPF